MVTAPGTSRRQLLIVARFEREAGYGVGLHHAANFRGLRLQHWSRPVTSTVVLNLTDGQPDIDLGGLVQDQLKRLVKAV